MQHPASPAKDAGPFNYDETRNPRRRLPMSVYPLRSGQSRNPRRLPTPPVSPAKAGTHVPSPSVRMPASCHRHRHSPTRLSGKSRNPRPLPGARIPTNCHRRRLACPGWTIEHPCKRRSNCSVSPPPGRGRVREGVVPSSRFPSSNYAAARRGAPFLTFPPAGGKGHQQF